MQRIAILLLIVLLPLPLSAEEPPVSRAEGYRLIWEPLKRPVEKTRETPFADVQEDHQHFTLLTYGKARGILNDDQRFSPDDPLQLNDALLWLLRSRNRAYPTDIRYDTTAIFLRGLGLLDSTLSRAKRSGVEGLEENPTLTRTELEEIIQNIDTALRSEIHSVSFYAEDFAGHNTAFGEKFDPNALTAAHLRFPHNTLVRVHNEDNGKSVVVRINDRGPYIDGRDMDLSRAAFSRIASLSNGVIHNVTFERVGSAEVPSSCPRTRYQRRLGRALLSPGIPRVIKIGTTIELTADTSFRLIQMRAPRMRPVRSRDWTERGDELTISFKREGIYTFVLHEDSGKRRRFRTRVISACEE